MFHRLTRIISVSMILAVGSDAGAASEFHVSPTGDDMNVGTRSAPFRTLERARDAVRSLLPTMSENITVYLRGGTHQRTNTFVLDETDSGRNGARVIWRNAEGESPTISGGEMVTGWTLIDPEKNIWRSAPVSCAIRQFYVNGVPAIRARGPNPDSYHSVASWDYAGRRINVPASTIGDWGTNPAGVEFVGHGEWMTHHSRIKAVTYTGSTAHLELMEPEASILFSGNATGFNWWYRPPFFFENALDLLDSPREWFQDSERRIHYRPASDEDLGSAQCIAPCVETLWRMEGSSLDALVQNITVQGLRFMYATWMDPSARGCIEVQAVQCASEAWQSSDFGASNWYRTPAAVYLAKAGHNQFIACTFRNLGASGIDLHYGCFSNVVEGCAFADIAGNGISMGRASESPISLPYAPADDRDVGDGDVIRDNFITRVGSVYRGGVGIFAAYSRGIRIEHNEVTMVPYTGISLGWGWTSNPTPMRNNHIEGNRVTDVMQVLRDGGGIYTLSDQPNSVWRRNHIARSGDHGIYPDEGTGHYQIERNVTELIANKWLRFWTPTIHENTVDYCYTDNSRLLNNGTNCTVTNTQYHPNRDWPAEALAIIAESGPRSPYRGTFDSLIQMPDQNIAAAGIASASSIFSDGYAASNANDNRPSGWSATSPDTDVRPWLRIDLLAPSVIRRIELVTRQEAEYDQAETRRNFEIQASNDLDFASYIVLGSQGETALPHMSTWSLDLENPVTYRYVRAKKSVDEYFFISELRVFPTTGSSGMIGDADGDGLPDAWETANGLASDLRTDATEDWDDDGHSNRQEYEADTDPRNPRSQLRMVDCRRDGLNIAISWVGGTQATQTLQFAPSPAGPWVTIETIPPPTTPEMTRSLPMPDGHPVGFFRVAASR